jgi:hypothetical protein
VSISGGREVTEGVTSVALQVTLSEPLAVRASVGLSAVGSTAQLNRDYVLSPAVAGNRITFLPGETTKTIFVNVNADTLREPAEKVSVSLTTPSNCTLGIAQAAVTIIDDDSYSVELIGPADSVPEGSGAAFQIKLSSPATKAELFAVSVSDESARSGRDFGPVTKRAISIPKGATSASFSIPILADSVVEYDETFQVRLTSAQPETPLPSPVRVTIAGLPPPRPRLSVADVSVLEGNSGTTNAIFRVSLSAASKNPVSVAYATTDSTATVSNGDFTPVSGTLTFAAGETSKTLSVPVRGDNVNESNEQFRLVLADAVNATLAKPIGTATIINDDVKAVIVPTISVADLTLPEGNTGTTAAQFTVTLSQATAATVSVAYTTAGGTATVGSDYVAASGNLVFRPGELSKTVAVAVKGDVAKEAKETFTLIVRSPVNATLAKPIGTATILNDDVDVPGFQINVNFLDSVPAVIRDVVTSAVAGWQQVITGDIPSAFDPFTGEFVDDLVLDVRLGLLGAANPTGSDQAENALANATFRYGAKSGEDGTLAIRKPSGLPFHATIGFDPADIPTNSDSILQLYYVAIHEIAHALGFGSLWNYDAQVGPLPQSGLITGFGTPWPLYVGVNAVREYNAVFGTTRNDMPVENTPIQGTYGMHWNEAIMGAELMTSVVDYGVKCPFSRITIGAMQDLGYDVNYGMADAYAAYRFVEWGQSSGGNGHAYALFNDSVSWPEARRLAESLIPPTGFRRGTLVSISSEAENRFLASWVPFTVWMGFTDEVVDGEWRWIDGTPGMWQDPAKFRNPVQTTYVNWAPGEPSSYYLDFPENYGLFRWGAETWNDGVGPVGGLPFPFLVEFVRQ